MSTTSDVFNGLAGLLQAAGVGRYIPKSDTTDVYAAGDTAITRRKLPGSPDRAISLRLMPSVADTISPFATYLLQVLSRGNPNDADDAATLDQAVRDHILGLTDIWFGPTHVIQVRFAGSVDLDADESERDQWSTKYLVDVDEAPTSLRPEGGAWD